MHYQEGSPEAHDGHRMTAQLRLAEILGVSEDQMIDWIECNGKKFASLVDDDSDWVGKLNERNLTEAEISFLRDEFLADKADTGAEEHEDESFIRAE